MIDRIYKALSEERRSPQVTQIDPRFYDEVSRRIKYLSEVALPSVQSELEEALIQKELRMTARLFSDLIETRLGKLLETCRRGESLPPNRLTHQEEAFMQTLLPVVKRYMETKEALMKGQVDVTQERDARQSSLILVRILCDLPAIIGVDLKRYGPLKAEDIASLPLENAELLIRHSQARKIELQG
jgi:DNA replication factor GINS